MEALILKANGLIEYSSAVKLQEALVELRYKEIIPDIVLLLEHPPVITLGVKARKEQIIAREEQLIEQNISVCSTNRGGSITYHGPGQLVMYPIIKLGKVSADTHNYLGNLEEVAIMTCLNFGVKAFRKKGKTGAWTDWGKIAAIGVRFKRWITYHGMSFNICPNMEHFKLIIPCGLVGEKVTSLASILNDKTPDMSRVISAIVENFSKVFQCNVKNYDYKKCDIEELKELLMNSGWLNNSLQT